MGDFELAHQGARGEKQRRMGALKAPALPSLTAKPPVKEAVHENCLRLNEIDDCGENGRQVRLIAAY